MSELRQRLIDIEPLSAERNQKLQTEIQAMFEPKLTKWEKIYWGASVAGSTFFALCAAIVVFAPRLDPTTRAIWAALGLGNAAAAAFILRGMRKGSLNLREQFALGKLLPGVAMLIAILILINAIARPSLENLAWGLVGVIGLILAGTITILNQVLSAELNTRERSLQLEYRLAELMETLAERQ